MSAIHCRMMATIACLLLVTLSLGDALIFGSPSNQQRLRRKWLAAAHEVAERRNGGTETSNEDRSLTIESNASDEGASSSCQNILVQQNMNGPVSFNRTWSEYKMGFGSSGYPSFNYWIGNEQLHRLTQDGKYKLRFELQSRSIGRWYWAEYDWFKVGDESTQYTLTIGGFRGNIGCIDAVDYHNGMKFSTVDRDNDRDSGNPTCAQRHGGGFWYRDCAYWHVNAAGDQFKWWYDPRLDMILQTSRMWLVCR